MPAGVLLEGDPGLGKTLMAKCFIEESGLEAYTVRLSRDRNTFIRNIADTFSKATENAPAIVFFDDIDKFANEDHRHTDAPEYVTVQGCIDVAVGFGVFILATANDVCKLPESLIRPGRFDRRIRIECPSEEDGEKIIEYYLSDKNLSDGIDMKDVAKMIKYKSCAELETIINCAAMNAAYARRDRIRLDDIVESVLRMEYESPEDIDAPISNDVMKKALHEAGHLVVSEVLCPGSVGLVSIRKSEQYGIGGFVRRCRRLPDDEYNIIVSLAGKAAVELYYSESAAFGCREDIKRTFELIRDGISEKASLGFGMIDVATNRFRNTSENMNSRNEAVTHAELERYYMKAKDILLKNREFLEKAAKELEEKETLLYSDIHRIKDDVTVTNVAI